MAKPGTKPKPVELKAIENRGHRPLNLDTTFRPEVGLPSVPKDLSAGARKVWRRLSTELLRYNLMSAVYSDTFEDLCETIADVKMLRHSLRKRQALLLAGLRSAQVPGVVLSDGPGIAGGGTEPGSPSIVAPAEQSAGTPDPWALTDLATDVRPQDYA